MDVRDNMNGKKILKSINKLITDPTFRFNIVSNAGVYNYLKDEEYLKRKFKAYMGKELDLNNPKTFNEKMQWLKLNNRKPQYTIMADKLKVRSFIAEKIGKEYLIPYIGSWENTSEINFEQLPNSFVIKCKLSGKFYHFLNVYVSHILIHSLKILLTTAFVFSVIASATLS